MFTLLANSDSGESGLALFLPEASEVFWSAVIMVICAVVFIKMVFPKINQVLSERQSLIAGKIEQAAQTEAEAKKLYLKYQQDLASLKEEGAQIRSSAKAQAEQIITDAKSKAAQEANKIITNANTANELQARQISATLLQDAKELALSLSQKIVGKSLEDGTVQSSVVDGLINDLNAKK